MEWMRGTLDLYALLSSLIVRNLSSSGFCERFFVYAFSTYGEGQGVGYRA